MLHSTDDTGRSASLSLVVVRAMELVSARNKEF